MDEHTLYGAFCHYNDDGEDIMLVKITCETCTNDFFIRKIHENKPSCCPYCEVKFTNFEVKKGSEGSVT